MQHSFVFKVYKRFLWHLIELKGNFGIYIMKKLSHPDRRYKEESRLREEYNVWKNEERVISF